MKVSDTGSTILYIVLGVVLAILINNGLAFALSTDMPIVAVESNSMVPTFSRGDILVLQGVPATDLTVGDIIVFSPSERQTPVVHRIVKLNDDGTLQTKGDANAAQLPFEKSIEAEEIHGKSILMVPYLGWVKIGITEYVVPNAIWFILVFAFGYLMLFVYKRVKIGGVGL